jgi:RNA polymerase sigma-70 factor (ECF subfamily)
MQDRTVQKQMSQSNTDQFVRLLTESQSRLYAYILTLVPDHVAADDVLSETNTTLWRKSGEFTLGTSFEAWSVRVAYFEILSYLRKQRNERKLFSGELLEEIAVLVEMSLDDFSDRRKALRNCLRKLPTQERQIVNLRYLKQLPVQTIAEQRGKTPNAMAQTLFRIRQTLAECVNRTLHYEERE